MTKKYEIILKYIQDLSIEIPSAEAFIFSRDNIDLYESNDNIDQQLIINLGICYSFN